VAVEDYKLFNKLATAFNSTFGTSGPGEAGLVLQSVKFDLIDEKTVKAKYASTVTFTNTENLQSLMKKFENEAHERIKSALKKTQENFENLNVEDVKKKTVSFEMETKNTHSDIEYLNVFSPVKRAFYKYQCLVTIK
jgi:hypothetical protein